MGKNNYFGIDEIDSELLGIDDKSNFLVKSNFKRQPTILSLHFSFTGIKNKKRILYISSHRHKVIKYYANYIGYDLDKAINEEKIMLISYPDDIKTYISDRDNFDLILEDLNSYIELYKPDRIIFDDLKTLIWDSSKNDKLTNLLFNKFLYFTKQISGNCLFVYNPENSSKIDKLAKSCYGTFLITGNEIKLSKQETPYIIHFENRKTKYISFHKKFDVIYKKGIQIKQNIQKQEIRKYKIDKIFYPHHYSNLAKKLSDNKISSIKTTPYNSIEEALNLISSNINELILVDEYVDGISGYKSAIAIKLKNKQINIGLITTAAISPNRKILASRSGITNFLYFPFTNNHITNFLESFVIVESLYKGEKIKVLLNSIFKNIDRDDTFMDIKEFKIRLKRYSIKVTENHNNYVLTQIDYDSAIDEDITNEIIETIKPNFLAKYYTFGKISLILIKKNIAEFDLFTKKVNYIIKQTRKNQIVGKTLKQNQE
ncbi:MAG: ATPase domain-containing protein, partial [Candidatus Cloacimonadota bacterium]|nr:ATPase domain-containing protein [Candidatus Cloacimonadota bacterium]